MGFVEGVEVGALEIVGAADPVGFPDGACVVVGGVVGTFVGGGGRGLSSPSSTGGLVGGLVGGGSCARRSSRAENENKSLSTLLRTLLAWTDVIVASRTPPTTIFRFPIYIVFLTIHFSFLFSVLLVLSCNFAYNARQRWLWSKLLD